MVWVICVGYLITYRYEDRQKRRSVLFVGLRVELKEDAPKKND